MTRDQARDILDRVRWKSPAEAAGWFGMPLAGYWRFMRQVRATADPAPPRPQMTPAEARAEYDRLRKTKNASGALGCSLKHARRHMEWLRELAYSDQPPPTGAAAEMAALMQKIRAGQARRG